MGPILTVARADVQLRSDEDGETNTHQSFVIAIDTEDIFSTYVLIRIFRSYSER